MSNKWTIVIETFTESEFRKSEEYLMFFSVAQVTRVIVTTIISNALQFFK